MLRISFLMRSAINLCALLAASLVPSSTGSISRVTVWQRDQLRAAASLCNPNSTNKERNSATLLFLHVFKAAGSTTRETLQEYASNCHLPFKEAGHVCSRDSANFLCLSASGQVRSKAQAASVQSTAVIAGHLWFGVHRVVKNVPVYVTCLRRPLDTAISGRIYLHEKEMKALSDPAAAQRVRQLLASRHFKPTGFSKRLTGKEPRYSFDRHHNYDISEGSTSTVTNSSSISSSSTSSTSSTTTTTRRQSKNDHSLDKAANQAIANLHKYFAVVGVVERYPAFVDLLQRVLDPSRTLSGAFWERQKVKHDNPSVKSTSTILKLIQEHDGAFIADFNSTTLMPEWKIYGAARGIFESMAQKHNVDIDQRKPAADNSSDFRDKRRDGARSKKRMLKYLNKKQNAFSLTALELQNRNPSLGEPSSPLKLPGLAATPSKHYSKAVELALQADTRSGPV